MSNKKEYKVLNPIAHSGRVERGEVVLLTEDEASNFTAANVELVIPVPVEEVKPEKTIDDMELQELKAKAEALNLSTTGSKADLQERIALAEQPAPEAPKTDGDVTPPPPDAQ